MVPAKRQDMECRKAREKMLWEPPVRPKGTPVHCAQVLKSRVDLSQSAMMP